MWPTVSVEVIQRILLHFPKVLKIKQHYLGAIQIIILYVLGTIVCVSNWIKFWIIKQSLSVRVLLTLVATYLLQNNSTDLNF